MKTEIHSLDRELTEDEFWAGRRKLEAEGFELAMTHDVSTNTGQRKLESHIRSLEKSNFEFRELRKPNGAIQILKREKKPDETEGVAVIQQATRDNVTILSFPAIPNSAA